MHGHRKAIYLCVAVLVALLSLLVWHWAGMRAYARLGAAFGARVTCSCRYVEGRGIDSCGDDKEPGMWAVAISDHPESKSVEAHVPLLATRTARYRPGWGCLLDPAS